ncbi:MAG: hypothetical protein ACLU5K_00875 [Christensenellales bacterium]
MIALGARRSLNTLTRRRCRKRNWNQRYRDNLALKGGDIYDVADVIKCLKRRDSLKGLSAGDRKMLITARQVLSAELSAASGRDIDEIRDIIG